MEKARSSLKRKANEDIGERPSKKICKEIEGKEGFFDMTARRRLSKGLQYERRKLFPEKLPRNIDESIRYLKTKEDSRFVRKVDSTNKVVMIGNKDILSCLDNQEHIYCDGTFRNCPKFFHQMYTFFILENGFYVPFLFFLLPDKTTKTYKTMLNMLKVECGLGLDLKSVTIDFEASMIKALRLVYPNVEVHCCRFHLGQSWLRKIRRLGLIPAYSNKSNLFGLWLKSLHSLAAITPDRVGEFYFKHKENLSESTLNGAKAKKFFNYIEKNYIRSDGLFPPKSWAGLIDKEDIRYTNNGAESFHKHFNSMFNSNQRPHILKFLEVMREVDSLSKLKLQSSKTLKLNAFSTFKKEHSNLITGNISIQSFLQTVTKTHVLPLEYK